MYKNIFFILLLILSIFMFIGCRKHQQNHYMDESEFDNVKSTTNINVIINGKKYHSQ